MNRNERALVVVNLISQYDRFKELYRWAEIAGPALINTVLLSEYGQMKELSGNAATTNAFVDAIVEMERNPSIEAVDVIVILHGNKDGSLVFADRTIKVDGATDSLNALVVRKRRDACSSAFDKAECVANLAKKDRMVLNTSCYGTSAFSGWRAIGFKAIDGSRGVSADGAASGPAMLDAWSKGYTFGETVDRGNAADPTRILDTLASRNGYNEVESFRLVSGVSNALQFNLWTKPYSTGSGGEHGSSSSSSVPSVNVRGGAELVNGRIVGYACDPTRSNAALIVEIWNGGRPPSRGTRLGRGPANGNNPAAAGPCDNARHGFAMRLPANLQWEVITLYTAVNGRVVNFATIRNPAAKPPPPVASSSASSDPCVSRPGTPIPLPPPRPLPPPPGPFHGDLLNTRASLLAQRQDLPLDPFPDGAIGGRGGGGDNTTQLPPPLGGGTSGGPSRPPFDPNDPCIFVPPESQWRTFRSDKVGITLRHPVTATVIEEPGNIAAVTVTRYLYMTIRLISTDLNPALPPQQRLDQWIAQRGYRGQRLKETLTIGGQPAKWFIITGIEGGESEVIFVAFQNRGYIIFYPHTEDLFRRILATVAFLPESTYRPPAASSAPSNPLRGAIRGSFSNVEGLLFGRACDLRTATVPVPIQVYGNAEHDRGGVLVREFTATNTVTQAPSAFPRVEGCDNNSTTRGVFFQRFPRSDQQRFHTLYVYALNQQRTERVLIGTLVTAIPPPLGPPPAPPPPQIPPSSAPWRPRAIPPTASDLASIRAQCNFKPPGDWGQPMAFNGKAQCWSYCDAPNPFQTRYIRCGGQCERCNERRTPRCQTTIRGLTRPCP
ncbi:hypothetical protein HYZ99_03500 [Candidatus Peregrinibacteria bacterium]|nr:hypothetical protein [Candidatus Peregrinibacteria bacterium]